MPAVRLLKAAAEEGAEPAHAELLRADAAAIRLPQHHTAPLQLPADVVDERPDREGVVAYLLEGRQRASVRDEKQAASEQELHDGGAVQDGELDVAVAGGGSVGEENLWVRARDWQRGGGAAAARYMGEGEGDGGQAQELHNAGPHAGCPAAEHGLQGTSSAAARARSEAERKRKQKQRKRRKMARKEEWSCWAYRDARVQQQDSAAAGCIARCGLRWHGGSQRLELRVLLLAVAALRVRAVVFRDFFGKLPVNIIAVVAAGGGGGGGGGNWV
jgi:hypothetical protein